MLARMPSELTLLRLRPAVLYRLDAAHRIVVCARLQMGPPPPHFCLCRTPHGNIWRLRADIPDALAAVLHECFADEPVIRAFGAPPRHYAHVRHLLQADARVRQEHRGPTFVFRTTPSSPDDVVPVPPNGASLVRDHFPWLALILARVQPCWAVIRDGVAVSICYSARNHPRAAEAGVETLPDFRCRGFATRVTAAWAAAVRRQGRIALYSTSWDNAASFAVARHLGAHMYGEDWSLG